jgi:hypothetical protein
MSFTLTTSGACIFKAGRNANTSVVTSGALLVLLSDLAEGSLSFQTRKDWVADYSNINANFKPVLSDTVSDMVAMKIINYDLTAYTSQEAQTMLDVLKDNITKNVALLNNETFKEVL